MNQRIKENLNFKFGILYFSDVPNLPISSYHFLSIRVIILFMQMNRGLIMNEENKYGYWIHEK